jgi:hypothetical protein
MNSCFKNIGNCKLILGYVTLKFVTNTCFAISEDLKL